LSVALEIALASGIGFRYPYSLVSSFLKVSSVLTILIFSPLPPLIFFKHKMPVPRRRQSLSRGLMQYPKLALKLFDASFMFEKTKTLLLWGFLPGVIIIGMNTEPTPSSYFEIINILE
jgi:hypothetical protein